MAGTYADWKASVFSATEQANPSISGEGASPAGDGISNLGERQTTGRDTLHVRASRRGFCRNGVHGADGNQNRLAVTSRSRGILPATDVHNDPRTPPKRHQPHPPPSALVPGLSARLVPARGSATPGGSKERWFLVATFDATLTNTMHTPYKSFSLLFHLFTQTCHGCCTASSRVCRGRDAAMARAWQERAATSSPV